VRDMKNERIGGYRASLILVFYSGMILGQLHQRQRELAIRSSLGASKGGLLRVVLREILLLAGTSDTGTGAAGGDDRTPMYGKSARALLSEALVLDAGASSAGPPGSSSTMNFGLLRASTVMGKRCRPFWIASTFPMKSGSLASRLRLHRTEPSPLPAHAFGA
jgi:hypothetical protein